MGAPRRTASHRGSEFGVWEGRSGGGRFSKNGWRSLVCFQGPCKVNMRITDGVDMNRARVTLKQRSRMAGRIVRL